eukprot:4626097-Alexandrium_andersonii.AAC.1
MVAHLLVERSDKDGPLRALASEAFYNVFLHPDRKRGGGRLRRLAPALSDAMDPAQGVPVLQDADMDGGSDAEAAEAP